ncbi:hypothetical protein BY458DRAFT_474597 [Sporodiniella umbellata]|nr:hypothetical protein BY458DRAFT_474597 [Sporodiniella umbellata]
MTDDKPTQANEEKNDDGAVECEASPRIGRRPVTMSTRRNSRLLYLEKYGLNQPGWHSSDNLNDCNSDRSDKEEEYDEEKQEKPKEKHNAENKEEHSEKIEEYEKPLDSIEIQRKKIEEYKALPKTNRAPDPSASSQRLTGDRPLKRPVSIRNYVQNTSAQKRPSKFVKPVSSASSIGKVVLPPTEFIHIHKLLEAYEKKIYIEGYLQKKNDLKSNGVSCNTKKWSVWYVELCGPVLSLWDASSSSTQDVYPQYINVTDSTVSIEGSPVPNTFSLNTAGANRYILQTPGSEALRHWVSALRLSCFECSRIQEIYTLAFLSRPRFSSCFDGPKKPRLTATGFLHVRFPNGTGWKQYWVSVSNERRKKGLFSKKMVPTHGRILFYESKKAKYPVMTLQRVVQAYTVYPESPKLINMATLFKIEGSLYENGQSGDLQPVQSCSGVLLMSPSTEELAEWLVNIYDAFELHGRPNSFLNDPKNPKALNFGDVTISNTRLFLELKEIGTVDIKESLLSNKSDFSTALARKLKNAPLRAAASPSSPSKLINNMRHSKTLTYASDVSDEEDKKSESESESEDESVFKPSTQPVKLPEPNKEAPVSNTASKSSSDISEVSSSNTIAGTANLLLQPITKSTIEDDFANSILNSPQFSNIAKQAPQQKPSVNKTVKASLNKPQDSENSLSLKSGSNQKKKSSPEKRQPKQTSTQRSPVYSPRSSGTSAVWSSNHSVSSVVNPEYNNNWETSSVGPRMMTSPVPPSFSGDTYRYDRPTSARYSSSVAGYAPLDNMYANTDDNDNEPIGDKYPISNNISGQSRGRNRKSETPYFKPNNPSGYFNTTDNRNSTDEQSAIWNRMVMEQRQHQMMMQQYMQTYNAMPMMMPLMDPRLYPQPYMMMDPRLMPPSPMGIPPNMMFPPSTASVNTNFSNRSFRNSQPCSKDTDSHRRYEKRNMSSAASVTDSAYASDSRPRRAKN